MKRVGIVIFLLLTAILAGLIYYGHPPMSVVQRILGVGLLHGTLEWLPTDPFGYFPTLAYSYLGFSDSIFESLVPYLKIGSVLVVMIKLIEDSFGIVTLLFARAWSQIWEMEFVAIEDVAKILTGFFAVFASSQLLVLGGFYSSLQPYLTEFVGYLTNLSLGIALIAVGLVSKRIGKKMEDTRAGVLIQMNIGQLIVTGLMMGLLSIPGVNSGPAGFAVLTLGGFEPEMGLRIQYVMMVPLFATFIMEAYTGNTIALPIGLDLIQTLLVVFAVTYFGYITLSIIIAIAKRLGAPEMCIIFGLILLTVFTMQEGITGRLWDLLTLLRSLSW